MFALFFARHIYMYVCIYFIPHTIQSTHIKVWWMNSKKSNMWSEKSIARKNRFTNVCHTLRETPQRCMLPGGKSENLQRNKGKLIFCPHKKWEYFVVPLIRMHKKFYARQTWNQYFLHYAISVIITYKVSRDATCSCIRAHSAHILENCANNVL